MPDREGKEQVKGQKYSDDEGAEKKNPGDNALSEIYFIHAEQPADAADHQAENTQSMIEKRLLLGYLPREEEREKHEDTVPEGGDGKIEFFTGRSVY